MYISSKQKKKNIIIFAVLLIGLPIMVFAAYRVTQLLTGASGASDPVGVIKSNLTTNSITLSWTTDAETNGTVVVQTNGDESAPFLDVRGLGKRKTHHIEITDLNPGSSYEFTITSDGDKYTSEGGDPFRFSTPNVSGTTPVPNHVYGTVEGSDDDDTVIYIVVGDTVLPASTATSIGGNWILDFSAIRDSSGTPVTVEADTEVTVIARGPDGTGSVSSGKYSELFDSEGKLNDSYELSLAEGVDVLSSLPAISQISAYVEVVEPAVVTPPVTTPPVVVEPVPEPEPETESVIVEFVREFLYKQDVRWTPIDGTSGSVALTSSVITGETSVKISNITDTSFTVIWISDAPVKGTVSYGTITTTLDQEAIDERDSLAIKGSYMAHSVIVTDLLPETEYFFEVNSGGSLIKNATDPFSTTTFATLGSPPEFKTVSGKVSGYSQLDDVVVSLQFEDKDGSGSTGKSGIGSVLSDSNGNWIAAVGGIRNTDGSEYFNFTDGDEISSFALVYGNTAAVTQSTEGIEAETITLIIEEVQEGSRVFVHVPALNDYGISQSGIIASYTSNTDTDDTSPTYTVNTDSSYTPKTALPNSMYIVLGTGVLALSSGAYIYSRSRMEVSDKKSMSNSIS